MIGTKNEKKCLFVSAGNFENKFVNNYNSLQRVG